MGHFFCVVWKNPPFVHICLHPFLARLSQFAPKNSYFEAGITVRPSGWKFSSKDRSSASLWKARPGSQETFHASLQTRVAVEKPARASPIESTSLDMACSCILGRQGKKPDETLGWFVSLCQIRENRRTRICLISAWIVNACGERCCVWDAICFVPTCRPLRLKLFGNRSCFWPAQNSHLRIWRDRFLSVPSGTNGKLVPGKTGKIIESHIFVSFLLFVSTRHCEGRVNMHAGEA